MRIAMAACLAATSVAHGGIIFNEPISGDLSDDRFSATRLTLGAESNTITGTFGRSPVLGVPDLDYVTLTIPAGWELDRVVVLVSDVGGAFSFIGVQAGGIITNPYTSPDPSPLLGWAHYGTASQGLDILPEIGGGAGAIGFSGPLPAGEYTFWIMELDWSFVHAYSFDFHLSPVPSPGHVWALALGIGVARRRRRLGTPVARAGTP